MAKAVKKNPDRIRERYAKEFKVEAVRLLKLGQKPATELALELGVRRNQLYKWAEQLAAKGGDVAIAFNGPGRQSHDQLSEIERLRRELKKVTEERDILKKAAAYFAKELP
ncbi:MAG: transposase [Usitatibacteraceae bacterium]